MSKIKDPNIEDDFTQEMMNRSKAASSSQKSRLDINSPKRSRSKTSNHGTTTSTKSTTKSSPKAQKERGPSPRRKEETPAGVETSKAAKTKSSIGPEEKVDAEPNPDEPLVGHNVTNSAINDSPSHQDHIGFAPFVKGISRMVTHPDTATPLTIGIYGPWGTGKTTFMKLVQQEIINLDRRSSTNEKHIHIWFDAWRHQTHEKVWAALLHTVTSEIEKTKSSFEVLRSRISLAWSKIDKLTKFFLGIIFIIVAGYYLAWLLEYLLKPKSQRILNVITWQGAPVFGIALAGSFWKTVGNVFSPLGINLRQIVRGKSFAAKVENVYTFTQDLNAVINKSVGKNGKVILYIDDLDRCSPRSIVEVVEAINIFLDLDKCVFLLGMDHGKVSRSLGFEYSKLDGDENESISERQKRYELYGSDFLRKIVQLPINIPPMRQQEIEKFSSYLLPVDTVTDSMGSETDILATTVSDTEEYTQIDFSDELKKNIKEMLLYLREHNPREIKRFVNRVQFYYLLAHIRDDFKYNDDSEAALLLWLLIRERCPENVKRISQNLHTHEMKWKDLLTGHNGQCDCIAELYSQLTSDKAGGEIEGNWIDRHVDKYDQLLVLTDEYFSLSE